MVLRWSQVELYVHINYNENWLMCSSNIKVMSHIYVRSCNGGISDAEIL
jgi:hypothetical protein